MAIAPLPAALPGTFFVLAYFRDSGHFRMYLDDDVGSSYIVKLSPTDLSVRLQAYGIDKQTANDAVDRAVEFRSVQCIPSQKRVISLIRRTPERSVVSFEQERNHAFAHI